MSPGGIVMLVCGGIALLGFPLDAGWHALFGEDVTLWGPTHLFMIGGAGVSTLGMWMVMRQGFELGRPRKLARRGHVRVAGALIIGLSTFQAEFDFGVPQFQLLYQPVLIAFAAGVALVCRAGRSARPVGQPSRRSACSSSDPRRGGACSTGRSPGYTTPHFPLYLAEAAAVELAALAAPRSPLRFALSERARHRDGRPCGEWGCSHVLDAPPWPASAPAAAVLALLAGLAGSVLGARLSQSLAEPAANARLPALPPAWSRWPGGRARALFFPLPRTGGDGTRAAIVPTPAGDGRVNVAVTLDPPSAARGNQWFEILIWQGRTPGRLRQLTALRQVAPAGTSPSAPCL